MFRSFVSFTLTVENSIWIRVYMYMGFPGGSSSKESPISAGDIEDLRSRGQEDPLQKGMATHSSILAWTEKPGGL